MTWLFRERWFWIVFLALVTIILAPFIVVSVILSLPPIFRLVSMIVLVVCWGVAGAYKEWIKSKREEANKQEKMSEPAA